MFNNISAVCRTAIAPGTAMRRQTVCRCADVYSLRSAKVCGASRATQRSASCCVMDLRHVCVLLSVALRCSAPFGAEWIEAINSRMRNPCAQHVSRARSAVLVVCACANPHRCACAELPVRPCAKTCRCACSAALPLRVRCIGRVRVH